MIERYSVNPDALAATRDWLRELGAGEFASPFRRDPLEFANSHIEHIEAKARELLELL